MTAFLRVLLLEKKKGDSREKKTRQTPASRHPYTGLNQSGAHFPSEPVTAKRGCTHFTGASPSNNPAHHLLLSIETTLEKLRPEAFW